MVWSSAGHAGLMVCPLSVQPLEKTAWQTWIERVYQAFSVFSLLCSHCKSYLEVNLWFLSTYLWDSLAVIDLPLKREKSISSRCQSLHFQSYPNKQKYTFYFHITSFALPVFGESSEASQAEERSNLKLKFNTTKVRVSFPLNKSLNAFLC